MMMKAMLLLSAVGAAYAACPGACSGHGSCKLGEVCECQPRWLGPDCNSRQCPYGLSWVTSAATATDAAGASYDSIASVNQPFVDDHAYMGHGGRHGYAECSDKGKCDRSSGECSCFDGYTGKGCRKMACPNDCSGNGMCMTNFEINSNYKSVAPDSQMWDWDKAAQCKCDAGYHGLDCSYRTCPVGDDPLTNCAAGTQVSDIQTLTWYKPQGGDSGWFALTFTDAYGANYTTRPIFAYATPEGPEVDSAQTGGNGAATAADIESALEGLPNFAIPNATVTYTGGIAQDTANVFDITFDDAGTAGKQVLLECSYTGAASYANSAASPKMVAPDHNTWGNGERVCTASHSTLLATYYPAAAGYSLKEAVTCSNRGDCDESSGVCDCWEGYTGEACSEQTVFF